MKTTTVLSGLGLLGMVGLMGCAHGTMRGSVAMKASEDEAHVCMGKNDVNQGDRVALFKNVCTGNKGSQLSGPRDGGTCTKVALGHGTVLRTLNEHYSVVKVDSGVQFEEGAIVEKL